MTAPAPHSQPMDKPVRQDDPRCDCGHLFEICNSPNCPKGDEYAVLANEERNRFTSRMMMSNLDGGKDSEIASLRARVEDLTRPFDAVMADDWAYLLSLPGDGPRGQFWKAALKAFRAALNTGEGE